MNRAASTKQMPISTTRSTPRLVRPRNQKLQFDDSPNPVVSTPAPPRPSAQPRSARTVAQPQLIYIPQAARGQTLATCSLSARLAHILEWNQFRRLGDLHGMSGTKFHEFRNCGKKTLLELWALVKKVQREYPETGQSQQTQNEK